MTFYFDNYDKAAADIIEHVGKTINIGVPLGLGKPIGLLNALFRIAQADSTINLTILTGLTLARPIIKNELEKRLVTPILDRILNDYEDPLYESYRELKTLPANINVIEFFLTPGKFLYNTYVQKNYISSSYSLVSRDVLNLSINVLAQQLSPASKQKDIFSLSCNTDLFHDVYQGMKKNEAQGSKIAVIAEINSNLPYMYGTTAEVNASKFTHVINTQHHRALFAVPREELNLQDHFIGLYTSTLIKDNGCLQVGIGSLSIALANALIFRHTHNHFYLDLIKKLKIEEKFNKVITESGSFKTFDRGLYASTEMLSDEYLQLYKQDILKKRVYDHIGLQNLLNTNQIDEIITYETLEILMKHKLINPLLTSDDVEFLKKFGIFKHSVILKNNKLIFESGETVQADLNSFVSKDFITKHCLGNKLSSGKIAHAGFFFGSIDLYSFLHHLPEAERELIEMSSIARTNTLLWSPELLRAQRQSSRFVNSALMVTLLGGIISDGLINYQELSGVGGQYDFVSMATQLDGARSIINCRSTRETKKGTENNIIWDYSNSTIPRYLRDIIVTEYGIADCRSKTDEEVIKSILNIADSRYQKTLLFAAKSAGKLSSDYQIPEEFTHNFPETLEEAMQTTEHHGYFSAYPFGSDLTDEEQTLANVLLYLKNTSNFKLFYLILSSFFFIKNVPELDKYLLRMKLKNVSNMKDYIYKNLIKYVLYLQLKVKISGNNNYS